MRLSERQREILEDMAAVCAAGLIWHPQLRGCYGAGDAAAIKALRTKGLAEPQKRSDGRDPGYSGVITHAGRDWLAHNASVSGAKPAGVASDLKR